MLRRLHDRKMCIIGLSLLMDLSSRPAVVEGVAGQIIPSILLLFLGLKHIYASRVLNKPEQFSRTQGAEEDENGKSLTQECYLIHAFHLHYGATHHRVPA